MQLKDNVANLWQRALKFKELNEPKAVQEKQKEITKFATDFKAAPIQMAKKVLRHHRFPYAKDIELKATDEMKKLLNYDPDAEFLAEARYIQAMESLAKLSSGNVNTNSRGERFTPLGTNLFPENNAGFPVKLSPGITVISSKGEWVKPEPFDSSEIQLRVDFKVNDNGENFVYHTLFNTGKSHVELVDSEDELMITEGDLTDLAMALVDKSGEIQAFSAQIKQNKNSSTDESQLIQDLGNLKGVPKLLEGAKFLLKHQLGNDKQYLLEVQIPVEGFDSDTYDQIEFDLKYVDENLHLTPRY